jgi:outer membrane protein with beta-barrel domain
MVRTVVTLILLVVILPALVCAQDAPRAEVFGGYQYLRVNPGVSGVDSFNLNGWNASLSGYFNRYIGITGDFGGAYGKPFGVSAKVHTFMFGPVVRVPNATHITPFMHLLGGGVHISGDVSDFSASETDGAWAVGGGLDANMNSIFSIRLAQVDLLQTRIGGDSQNNFRFSAGVVIKF